MTDPIGHGLARYSDPRGRGDEPGDPPRGGREACPSTSSTSRPGRRSTAVRTARDEGLPAFAETCPQYLFLVARRPGQRLRGRQVRLLAAAAPDGPPGELWKGLVKDDLQVVSTDHCPFDFHGQKELGRGDFRKVPNGLPGVEDRVDLLHDGGVVGGRITQERWVEIISTAPAKLFGMYPRKGAIAVGSDADIVVYDPNRTHTISASDAPHGRRLLVLRGPRGPGAVGRRAVARHVVVRDGEFTGRKGHGQFVKRAPADFARLA